MTGGKPSYKLERGLGITILSTYQSLESHCEEQVLVVSTKADEALLSVGWPPDILYEWTRKNNTVPTYLLSPLGRYLNLSGYLPLERGRHIS